MNELELIAKNLKARRKQLGYTQKTASDKAGITQHMWRFVEQGTRTPSLQNLVNMCKALDIKLIDLLKTESHETL